MLIYSVQSCENGTGCEKLNVDLTRLIQIMLSDESKLTHVIIPHQNVGEIHIERPTILLPTTGIKAALYLRSSYYKKECTFEHFLCIIWLQCRKTSYFLFYIQHAKFMNVLARNSDAAVALLS
jgi:hypothetical protein